MWAVPLLKGLTESSLSGFEPRALVVLSRLAAHLWRLRDISLLSGSLLAVPPPPPSGTAGRSELLSSPSASKRAVGASDRRPR